MMSNWTKARCKSLTQYVLDRYSVGEKPRFHASTIAQYAAGLSGTKAKRQSLYGIRCGRSEFGLCESLDAGTAASSDGSIVIRIPNDDQGAIANMDVLLEAGESWKDCLLEAPARGRRDD